MNNSILNVPSKLSRKWSAWRSIWSFLVNLRDMDFYKGMDNTHERCVQPSCACKTLQPACTGALLRDLWRIRHSQRSP